MPFPAISGALAVNRLDHADAARIDVGRRTHAQTADNGGGFIGDNIAEHIVGYNHVPLARRGVLQN